MVSPDSSLIGDFSADTFDAVRNDELAGNDVNGLAADVIYIANRATSNPDVTYHAEFRDAFKQLAVKTDVNSVIAAAELVFEELNSRAESEILALSRNRSHRMFLFVMGGLRELCAERAAHWRYPTGRWLAMDSLRNERASIDRIRCIDALLEVSAEDLGQNALMLRRFRKLLRLMKRSPGAYADWNELPGLLASYLNGSEAERTQAKPHLDHLAARLKKLNLLH